MVTQTIVEKAAKTKIDDDIPMTRISLTNYMEEDTVPTSVSHSKSELENENSGHLTATSKISETRMATTSLISTIIINSLQMSLACLSTTLKSLVPVLIHPPRSWTLWLTLSSRHLKHGCTITTALKKRYKSKGLTGSQKLLLVLNLSH